MSGVLNYDALNMFIKKEVVDHIKKEPVDSDELAVHSNIQGSFQTQHDTTSSINFSRDMNDFKLLELVQQNAHLYDRSRKDFRDTKKKNNTWKEIGKHFGDFSGSDSQKRFKNLRDRFAKYKKSQKNGDVDGSVPAVFQKMHFLSDHVMHRSTASYVPEIEATPDTSEENVIIADEEIEIAPPTENFSFSPGPSAADPLEQDVRLPSQDEGEDVVVNGLKKRAMKRKRQDLDSDLLEELKKANMELKQPPSSENELFGKMIAKSLDRMTEKTASEVQIHIMQYLHQKLYSHISSK